MKKLLFLMLAAVIGLISESPTAHAADQFTFTIPYAVKSLMPQATGLEFNCYVFPEKPTGAWWSAAVGTGKKVVALDQTGSASGTVQVGVNVKPQFTPIDMKYYGCVVYLTSGSGTWGLSYDSPFSHQKAKPGTPLHVSQEGWLPGKGP